MITQLEQYIINRWEEITDSKQRPVKLSFLKLTNSGSLNRMVLLIFKDYDKRPFLVAKTVQSALNSGFIKYEFDKLKLEFDNLSTLQNLLSPPFDKTVPKPYSLTDIGGNLVLLENALYGMSLGMSITRRKIFGSRRRICGHFDLVKQWLIGLHIQTKAANVYLDDRKMQELIVNHIDRYNDIFTVSSANSQFFQQICARAKQFTGQQIPVVFEHGAFWLGNILISGDDIGVIDWESSHKHSVPFYDLFMFPPNYESSRNREWSKDWSRSIRQAYYEKSWFSDIVAQFIRGYCEQMNIDITLANLFFPIFLVVMANRSYERRHAEETTHWRRALDFHTEMAEDLIF